MLPLPPALGLGLTALGLEGTARWLIEAEESDGAIRTAQRSI